MSQFIDSGLVNQGDNGEFTLQNSGSPSKFKPCFDEWIADGWMHQLQIMNYGIFNQ